MASKKGQSIRYFEQFYQIWDKYIWTTPEKGQPIVPTPICWEQREQKIAFGDCPMDPKELKYVGYLFSEQCEQTWGHLSPRFTSLLAWLSLEVQPWDLVGGPERHPMTAWIELRALASSRLCWLLHFRICLCSWKY